MDSAFVRLSARRQIKFRLRIIRTDIPIIQHTVEHSSSSSSRSGPIIVAIAASDRDLRRTTSNIGNYSSKVRVEIWRVVVIVANEKPHSPSSMDMSQKKKPCLVGPPSAQNRSCALRFPHVPNRMYRSPAAVPRVTDRGRHLYAKLSSSAADCGRSDTELSHSYSYNTSSYTSKAMLLRRQLGEGK